MNQCPIKSKKFSFQVVDFNGENFFYCDGLLIDTLEASLEMENGKIIIFREGKIYDQTRAIKIKIAHQNTIDLIWENDNKTNFVLAKDLQNKDQIEIIITRDNLLFKNHCKESDFDKFSLKEKYIYPIIFERIYKEREKKSKINNFSKNNFFGKVGADAELYYESIIKGKKLVIIKNNEMMVTY